MFLLKKVFWLAGAILVIIIIGLIVYLSLTGQKSLSEKERLANISRMKDQAIISEASRLEQRLIQQAEQNNGTLESLDNLSLPTPIKKLPAEQTATNSITNIESYLKAVNIALDPIQKYKGGEGTIFLKAYEGNDAVALTQLKQIYLDYQKMSASLQVVKIPNALYTSHLKLQNKTKLLTYLLEKMSNVGNQSLEALEAGEIFNREQIFFFEIIKEINNKLTL